MPMSPLKPESRQPVVAKRKEAGLTTTEYAIAGALVSLAIVLAFSDLGTAIGKSLLELAKAIIE